MKRYQVFVSSPYEDLAAERQLVSLALINNGYLPSGMELFAATPAQTWPYIEEAIRLSDYYVLILKNRHGSMAEGLDVSWTEREYEFARSLGKPVLAFLYRGGDAVEPRMAAFRAGVMTQRLVRFWTEPHDLAVAVLGSLQDAVRTHPAPGWIRTDSFRDEEESMLTYYRRSADFDFAPFIASLGPIKILLNDGFSWLRRNEAHLRERFARRPQDATCVLHIAADNPLLSRIARKSGKSLAEQRADIRELDARLRALAADTGYEKLEIHGHATFNTHCIYICASYVVVTTYFTANNRFLHLPLYKFRAGTSIYDDFVLDFDILYRGARAAKA
ncbi:MAG TPA: DUF4062 domain-containing protein [Rhizomicrobium sp.]